MTLWCRGSLQLAPMPMYVSGLCAGQHTSTSDIHERLATKWIDNGHATSPIITLSNIAHGLFVIHDLVVWSEAVYVSSTLAQS